MVSELDGFRGKYQGSFAVHYFQDEASIAMSNTHTYFIVTQSCLNDLPEQFVDQGLKDARKNLMAKFGRTEKEINRG